MPGGKLTSLVVAAAQVVLATIFLVAAIGKGLNSSEIEHVLRLSRTPGRLVGPLEGPTMALLTRFRRSGARANVAVAALGGTMAFVLAAGSPW
jgi:hypothetical protein